MQPTTNEYICSQTDEGTEFHTKSILCMPIKNVAGKVIGVIQLVNKIDNTTFNKNDENLFEVRSLKQSYIY